MSKIGDKLTQTKTTPKFENLLQYQAPTAQQQRQNDHSQVKEVQSESSQDEDTQDAGGFDKVNV